ncbi:aldo/keto reductase [Pendulispora albinea]|uniref:Aldo/keto reductase n=1 Tax=Pendulispora albinea TaxID=2741071 RepID=A0ABZ2MCR1_9BACT
MRTARLGKSKVDVTALGFGAASIANLYFEVSDVDARAALDAAWDHGVRYFDTAPHYGLGLSERRLGAFLAGKPRDTFTVSTKVGRRLVPNDRGASAESDLAVGGFAVPSTSRRIWDFSADGVRRSLEDSLRRLGLSRVDVLLLHDPDDHWEQAVREGFPALADLRAQGVIGAIGVGMNQWQMPARFVRETDLDVVMLAGRYTLLEQAALDELLPLCAERGVSVVVAAVFNSGILAQATVPDDARYNYAEAPRELLKRARRMAEVCARHGIILPEAAIQFPLGHPAVASVVVGAHHASQIVTDAEMIATKVPGDLWIELKALGLLREDAPIPT